jgi:hypothetical protein
MSRTDDPTPGTPPTPQGMPRWVKAFLITAAVLAAAVIVLMLTGHNPGRHLDGHLGAPTTETVTLR